MLVVSAVPANGNFFDADTNTNCHHRTTVQYGRPTDRMGARCINQIILVRTFSCLVVWSEYERLTVCECEDEDEEAGEDDGEYYDGCLLRHDDIVH